MYRLKKIATFEYIVTKLIGLDLKKKESGGYGPYKEKRT